MILKKTTPEIFESLNWIDTVYILDNHINNPNEMPINSQIFSFSEGESKYNLLDGHLYCLKSILLD